MKFLDLVKQRYSCRSYQAKSVEQEKLDYVMECVRFAPSAVNKQPWRFRIVKNDEDKAKLQRCYDREWFQISLGFDDGLSINAMGSEPPENYDAFRADFLRVMADAAEKVKELPEQQ